MPPHRQPYLVQNPSDRIGQVSVPVDPELEDLGSRTDRSAGDDTAVRQDLGRLDDGPVEHLVGKAIAKGINSGEIDFADKHLSMFPQDLTYGYYRRAIILFLAHRSSTSGPVEAPTARRPWFHESSCPATIAKGINSGEIDFADKHLSMFPQDLTYGYYSLKRQGDLVR
jgi:acyl-CoA hydrolase